jgi:phage N-6-adenine-methyltransferase
MIKTDQWETPDDLFEKLNEEFNFEFDLCASKYNHKCDEWTDNIQNHALLDMHFDSYWMNPPYSRGNIDHCMSWMHTLLDLKAHVSIVTLTRFDPTTDWFQAHVDGVADEVRMLARRIKFKEATDSYNFPCCIAVYNNPTFNKHRPLETIYHIWDWKE